MNRTKLLLPLVTAALTASIGCGRGTPPPNGQPAIEADEADPAGQRTSRAAAVTAVPSGAQCVRLSLTRDAKTTTKSYDVQGNGPAVLDLGPQLAGSLSITGKAYDLACGKVDASSVASWLAETIAADLLTGVSTRLTLTFHRNETTTVTTAFVEPVEELFMGDHTTYALMRDGSVRAWGDNLYGQAGTGAAGEPLLVPTKTILANVKQIAAGVSHACALLTTGEVRCFGDNTYDKLGRDHASDTTSDATPRPLGSWAAGLAFSSITAAGDATCATTGSGDLWCWGSNAYPIITGIPDTDQSGHALVRRGVADAAGGDGFLCARDFRGEVICWGQAPKCDGTVGLAGAVQTRTRMLPVRQIAVAYGVVFGIGEVQGDTLYSCGRNGDGLTGNDKPLSYFSTAPDGILGSIAGVSGGLSHACLVDLTGQVYCWGSGRDGALGNDTNSTFQSPAPVFLGGPAKKVFASNGSASCALLRDGTLQCWGANESGQLGDGTHETRYVPVRPKL